MDLLNRGISTTNKKLYIIAVETGDRLDIQFVPPELTVSRNPNIGVVQIVGRNTPKYHYLSGETTISFELDFYADEETRGSVIAKCRWLEALTHNDAQKEPPQNINLVWGDLFRDEKWIVRRCKYRLSGFHKEKGMLPQQAYVNLQLALDPDYNLSWDDVSPELSLGEGDGGDPIDLGDARESDSEEANFDDVGNGITFEEFISRFRPF
jgi:hypothetical protein